MTTFAVEGCCHGDLDKIYEVLGSIEDTEKLKAEFLICCGDFQAIRTPYVFKYFVFICEQKRVGFIGVSASVSSHERFP